MIYELYLSAIRSLLSNKTRTFLTMLGIIIGVFAVITLIGVGEGIQNYVTKQFSSLGSNLLFVSPGKMNLRGDPGANFSSNKLDEKHVKLIETYCSDFVQGVTPYIEIGKTLTYKNKNYYTVVNAFDEDGFSTYNLSLESGRFFTRADITSNSKVVVLGSNILKELFSNQDPVGKNIKIGDKTFLIIGVAAEKGGSIDNRAYIPHTTAKSIFNIKNYSSIVMKATSSENIDSAMKRVEIALYRDLGKDEFTVLSQKDLLNSFSSILSTVTLGIGAIAAISLLVGGIGIMNIMLVTVTERTREIGLRKAVGATPNNIAIQFLIEATALSVLGGSIGIGLGILVAFLIRTYANFDATVPLWSVLLAFLFSACVGILFGTYPALKAAKKDPIEALRYE
jgi:putative ABC transport system permease protein